MSYSRKSNLENAWARSDDESVSPASSCYLHVPLCQQRCKYCDFYSTTAMERSQELSKALCMEINNSQQLLQTPLDTIFVGGGTPTALPDRDFGSLLTALAKFAESGTEFSVEANCNSLTDEKVRIMLTAGVNRLSVGVQSFNDNELKVLGRLHSADQAMAAIENSHRAGFVNISIDLIYGIPGQSLDSWKKSLEIAISLGATHLSCYCLDYPQGTELATELASGNIEAMDEELELECYRMALDVIQSAGMEHYEISNFALQGHRCRHNVNYWHNGCYAAIGPGAVGCINGLRQKNIADIDSYIAIISQGKSATDPKTAEYLTGRMKQAETLMLALRMLEGVDRHEFETRFGADLVESFPQTIERHTKNGLLILTDYKLRFSENALFVSDSILADFIDEANPQ